MKMLKFVMQTQEQQQWCWAAVAVSIGNFYGGHQWNQCSLVNSVLGCNNCCTDPCPGCCNIPWRLERALITVGHLSAVESGAKSYLITRAEIDSERPLCARIGWDGGGGHFVIIMGYLEGNDGDEFLHIWDPKSGKSIVTMDEFTRRYKGTGSWTHSYFTS